MVRDKVKKRRRVAPAFAYPSCRKGAVFSPSSEEGVVGAGFEDTGVAYCHPSHHMRGKNKSNLVIFRLPSVVGTTAVDVGIGILVYLDRLFLGGDFIGLAQYEEIE